MATSLSNANHGRSECIFKQCYVALPHGVAMIQWWLVSNSSLRSFNDLGIVEDEGCK